MGLLLNELSKLLEVGVAAKEVQISEGIATSLPASTTGTSAATSVAIASLSGRLEQINGFLATR